jgi:hypothetical protein
MLASGTPEKAGHEREHSCLADRPRREALAAC